MGAAKDDRTPDVPDTASAKLEIISNAEEGGIDFTGAQKTSGGYQMG
jgi:hypothetical protein